MGASGSGQGSKSESSSKSSSTTKLSSLAKTQEAILKERNQDYREYYLPEFKDFYSSLSPDSEAGKAQMGLAANEINASFDAAQKQTNQLINQQNLDGSGAGLALIAANNRAKSSALATAYANRMAETTANKGNALAQLAQLMPQTTTGAPTVGSSFSKSSSNSISGGGGGEAHIW
jgi:hypothetical protein